MSSVAPERRSASPGSTRRLFRPAGPEQSADATAAPASVERVDPIDGACGVFRDAAVVVRLNRRADPSSVSGTSFRVENSAGPIPGSVRLSPDGTVVIWTGARPFDEGAPHFVIVSGLTDHQGSPVTPHISRFVPCGISFGELADSET